MEPPIALKADIDTALPLVIRQGFVEKEAGFGCQTRYENDLRGTDDLSSDSPLYPRRRRRATSMMTTYVAIPAFRLIVITITREFVAQSPVALTNWYSITRRCYRGICPCHLDPRRR